MPALRVECDGEFVHHVVGLVDRRSSVVVRNPKPSKTLFQKAIFLMSVQYVAQTFSSTKLI